MRTRTKLRKRASVHADRLSSPEGTVWFEPKPEVMDRTDDDVRGGPELETGAGGGTPGDASGVGPAPAEPGSHDARRASTDKAWNDALSLLYDQAKQTIAEWCRDADRSARQLIADAEATRRQAHLDANRIREEARLEAGRILASAEAQAGRLRAEAQLTGAGRLADVEELRNRVETMEASIDQLLMALEGVMSSVAGFARPTRRTAGALGPGGERTDGVLGMGGEHPGPADVDVREAIPMPGPRPSTA